ncbi:uncharacterized protein [Littorina saxatilis]|uniref:uncharacterized protein n=1 Tax=Littorina saxatilis TaxID=31220 RepID=UPI0038B57B5B
MITNDIYATTPRDFSMPNSVQQGHSKDPVVSTGTCSPPPCGPILWSMKPSSDLFCTDSEFPIPGERCPEQKSEPGPCKLTSPNASHLNNHFSQGRAAEEGDYAEIDDCRKEGDVVHVSSNVYVDVAEIQRRKREQRKQKEVCNGI